MVTRDNNIGKNIRTLRTAHNETQNDLARKINVEENTIVMYETGKRQPDMQKLQAIANHYGFPVDRLVSEELNDLDFSLHTLTWGKYISVFEVQFPIISTEVSKENQLFLRGYTLTQSIMQKLKKGPEAIYQQTIEDAMEAFAGAYDECASLPEAIANMLWLMFISYALMPDEHSVKMGEAVLYGKSLKKDFVKKYVLKDANPVSEKDAANKREYVKDSQDGMLQLIRILKQSDTYSDLADYYLAMRYAIGMVANDYSDDLNKTIGMEMLTAYASLGNQYVLNYFRAVQGI